ncbi:MAG: SNF2 helicase-associated domain-containing protein, partial [Acidobacteriota bacterium]|nr:SNF2 helicase-associated domain-containing protein [Acidobacteriota bacterium]
MIVLHAAFCAPSLAIWGEASDSPKSLSASPAILAAAVSTTKAESREAVAWLPTIENRPVPSSTLIAEQPASVRSAYLAPWIVTVIPLDAPDFVNLLTAWRGKHLIQPSVVAGDDLAYWINVLQVAASLLARGQFLPGLVSRERAIEARWKPVIPATDAARIQSLVDAMPASAHALTWRSADRPPELSATRVLREFLEGAVDALIRSCERPGPLKHFDSIHDRWMHALTSADPVITGDASELKNLVNQVGQWQQPIRVSERAPFRLCFRLEEPPEGSPDWHVRYLMQDARDPSLLVSARDAWAVNNKAPIRELLLASLGQAAAICPRIETSLRERAPAGYQVDATGAHDFLTTKASALEQSGFGIMLPGWWTRRGTQARLT